MNVLWFSAGVSSAVVLLLCRDEIDLAIYQHIDDQHPDTLRFLRDVEKAWGKEITIRQSPYKNVDTACRMGNGMVFKNGAVCTGLLKRRERKKWEHENTGRHTYFWGMDRDEKKRVCGLLNSMPNYDHRFPLIERELTKQDAHAILSRYGIKRPAMYDMGYHNNNCIGCVHQGMFFWNKTRKDFPEVFASRAKLERELGKTCLKGMYLDELPENAGIECDAITEDCGVFCWIETQQLTNPKND